MAERTDSIRSNVERSNEVVELLQNEQQPPARVRTRRSWYSRPASLASPSSPCLNRGLAPAAVYPRTPLRDIWSTPEAKRPRKSQTYCSPGVAVQSLDAVLEARRIRIAPEPASVQEDVQSYTPDYSPPEASFSEPDFLHESPQEGEESGARDVAPVQSPATPSKTQTEPTGTPTKAARIISGLLSSPARVHSSPGRMLITKTCRRWWFTGHSVQKCKRLHIGHGKKPVKEKEQSVGKAQSQSISRLTRVIMGRVAKHRACQKRNIEMGEKS